MTNTSEHRVRLRTIEDNSATGLGDALELVDKDGNVLLVTRDVSVETLVNLVHKDKTKHAGMKWDD